MEPRLRLQRFLPRVGIEPGTIRSAGQLLTPLNSKSINPYRETKGSCLE